MTPQPAFTPPDPPPKLTYLSLGWGVQSWTIAAMIALGHLPPIDVAIHSDTGYEAAHTYLHAEQWTPWLQERGLKVLTVKPNDNDIIKTWGQGTVQIPAMTLAKATGKHGQIARQCTRYWKIKPIHRTLRELLGTQRPKPASVHSWQGISLDEFTRMRSSDTAYITNVYPLVDMRMTRNDCIQWLTTHDLPVPPKSACVFCPFHRISHWKDMKSRGDADWDLAVAVDHSIRDIRQQHTLYLHPARLPLPEAIRIPEDYGAEQLEMDLPCDGGVCFN